MRVLVGGILLSMACAAAQAGQSSDHIAKTGRLQCGVIREPLDWNKDDLHGSLMALDAEMCRAVATSMLGKPDAFDLKPVNDEREGLAAIAAHQADIVAGVTPNTISALKYGVRFSMPFFQDPQGFMVHKADGISSLEQIAKRKLCYIDETDNGSIVLGALNALHITPYPFDFQEEGEMDAAIMDRHCQVTSALFSKLAEARGTFHSSKDWVFLPQTLRLVPATIAVDATDARLSGIVDMTISALLEAEYLGVTLDQARTGHTAGGDPRYARLMGGDWSTAVGLGLPHDWSRHLIATVGNYADIFNRTVGPGTLFNLDRGVNALWNQGGVMVPLPLQ